MQNASASNQSPLLLTIDPNARYFTELSFRETIDVAKLNKLLLTTTCRGRARPQRGGLGSLSSLLFFLPLRSCFDLVLVTLLIKLPFLPLAHDKRLENEGRMWRPQWQS